MMRFTYMFVAGLLAFNVSEAQDLKGPKAKNYKPWKGQADTATLVVKTDESSLQGPAYKNKKAWDSQANKVEIKSKAGVKENITGPKAKNRKVWKKD